MARRFEAQYHCTNCKTWQTQETAFGRWIRNNPALKSSDGTCVTDIDMTVTETKIIHQFKGKYGRVVQLMMMIEVKLLGADLPPAQRDTLHMLNQLVRNRRPTPGKKLSFQSGVAAEVRSTITGHSTTLRHYGVHLLQFSGLGPEDSESIAWDKKPITAEQLTELLAFNLDPDTLKPIDLRNHHAVINRSQELLSIKGAQS